MQTIPTTQKHNDEKYLRWSTSIREFVGWTNLSKFERFVQPEFLAVEFSCAGGYLLNNLTSSQKYGIEPGRLAHKVAIEKNSIDAIASADYLEDGWAEFIILNHLLEDAHNPLRELQRLGSKLKFGCPIIFFVSCESFQHAHKLENVNHHFYIWKPMCPGNLFHNDGFIVEESKPHHLRWLLSIYRTTVRISGCLLFNLRNRLCAHFDHKLFQVFTITCCRTLVQRRVA